MLRTKLKVCGPSTALPWLKAVGLGARKVGLMLSSGGQGTLGVFTRGHCVAVLGLAKFRDVCGFHGPYSLCFAKAEVLAGVVDRRHIWA